MAFTIAEESTTPKDYGTARFTVFGVGGGGGNAVEHMVKSGISGVSFVCANTDRQALDGLSAPHLIHLGEDGLGAGANPEVGREAAESSEEKIREILKGSDMVFVTVGMGGGTGTGASPVVARIAKEMGILTVAVVTTPLSFEGKKRINVAKEGVEKLVEHVDSIITIPNDKVLKVYGNITLPEAFKKANDILLNAVQGIADTITSPGLINIDFEDIRTAMTARGHAMMGVGRASGDDRARQAIEMATRSPLLDDVLLKNAKGLLVNVTAASDITLVEFAALSEVASQITDLEDANIFYGTVIDDSMGDELKVTVVATGLSLDENKQTNTAPIANSHQLDTGDHSSAISRKSQPVEEATHVATTTSAPKEKSNQNLSIHQYLRRQQKK